MMEIRNLDGITFTTIYETFLEAFRDYAVDVNYMNTERLGNRAIKNGYQSHVSAGAFENGKLVGFTLVGIDRSFIKPAAFDIMTGIAKEFRGQRVAGKMFELIKAGLLNEGIQQFYLEVLQENEPAVKAYKKQGFEIERYFNCYELNPDDFVQVMKLNIPLSLKEISKSEIEDFTTFADFPPSWENSFSSIQRIPDDLIIIAANYTIKKVGLIIYYPALNWIMNILVDPVYRNMGVGSALLEKLLGKLGNNANAIRFLNIPDDDYMLNDFLINSGFKSLTKQYEMVLELK